MSYQRTLTRQIIRNKEPSKTIKTYIISFLKWFADLLGSVVMNAHKET